MRELVESDAIPSPPKWKGVVMHIPEIPKTGYTMYYRDVNECVDALFGNPAYADSMDYSLRRIFEADGKTRVYHEFCTDSMWWDAQVSLIFNHESGE